MTNTNKTTATFANLDYRDFEQYLNNSDFLGLTLVSFRVENNLRLDIVLSGNLPELMSMANFVTGMTT